MLSVGELPGGHVIADGMGTFKPRAYQLEMLEESMLRNIIVAMDTGSGKTLMYIYLRLSMIILSPDPRAILRVQAELERCPPGKVPDPGSSLRMILAL